MAGSTRVRELCWWVRETLDERSVYAEVLEKIEKAPGGVMVKWLAVEGWGELVSFPGRVRRE